MLMTLFLKIAKFYLKKKMQPKSSLLRIESMCDVFIERSCHVLPLTNHCEALKNSQRAAKTRQIAFEIHSSEKIRLKSVLNSEYEVSRKKVTLHFNASLRFLYF